jgi:hypothetical protein
MLQLLTTAALATLLLLNGAYGETARVEILPFTSTTLKDSEFLAGGQGGQPVTIGGELRLPKTTTSFRQSSCFTDQEGSAAPALQSMNGLKCLTTLASLPLPSTASAGKASCQPKGRRHCANGPRGS